MRCPEVRTGSTSHAILPPIDDPGSRRSTIPAGWLRRHHRLRPAKPIAIDLDGTQFTGDPREIQLADRREVAIVIGTPPAVTPKVGDFSGA